MHSDGLPVFMVSGSRNPDQSLKDTLHDWMYSEFYYRDGIHWIHGGAIGIDSLFHERAKKSGHPSIEVFEPAYKLHGSAATHIRNDLMLDVAEKVFIFWDGKSPGTKSVIQKCNKRGIDYDLFKRS